MNGVPRRGWFEPPSIGEMSIGAKVFTYAALCCWAFVILLPIYWLLITAFKLPADVNGGPTYLPWVDFEPGLHAWRNIFVDDFGDMFKAYSNSIVVSLLSTALCVLIGSLAAYALVRIEYRPKFGSIVLFVLTFAAGCISIGHWGVDWRIGVAVTLVVFFLLWRAITRRRLSDGQMIVVVAALVLVVVAALLTMHFAEQLAGHAMVIAIIAALMLVGTSTAHWLKRSLGNPDILFWVISQRILPPIVVVLPVYIMFQRIGLLDTHLALILSYAVVNLPIVVWLMHDFMSNIPIDLEESAQLDGASRLQTFWEVVLPLARPGLAATTLLTLILSWNEYLLAVFLTTSRAQTMPIMVAAQISQERGIFWWNMSVVIIVMIIPVVVMAILLQRFIARGVLLGAVKG
ncbi:MAG: carbohydrate ABC transporter permease [Gammaproteobacteria bacterium]